MQITKLPLFLNINMCRKFVVYVQNILTSVGRLAVSTSKLYKILIAFIFFSLLFDVITTYFGLDDPTVFEYNPFTGLFIGLLGREIGLVTWFLLVLISYLVLINIIDVAKLYVTEVGFCVLFGFRHLIAGVSNLSIWLNATWLRLVAEKIFVFWPFSLIVFVLVALVEFLLERT